jgi:hypothetical protein
MPADYAFVRQFPAEWHRWEDDGFKVLTCALFAQTIEPGLSSALDRHLDKGLAETKNAGVDAWAEIILRYFCETIIEYTKLQRIAFDHFLQFLSFENVTSTAEARERLLWATDRVLERMVRETGDYAFALVFDADARGPAWLVDLTKKATAWLDRDRYDDITAEELAYDAPPLWGCAILMAGWRRRFRPPANG